MSDLTKRLGLEIRFGSDLHDQIAGLEAENDSLRVKVESYERRGQLQLMIGPKRICLCGSTKFKRAYQEWNARLTLEGNVVLSVAMWSHSERLNPTPQQKAILDHVHLAKIDIADEVFVLDVGGYIGESTRNEIAHAEKMGKLVRYLSKEYPDWTEDDCRWWQSEVK